MSTSDAASWHACEELLLAFESEWRSSTDGPDIAAFIARGRQADRNYLTLELIAIDLEHRWKRGLPALAEDYFALCPDDCESTEFEDEVVRREIEAREACGQRADAAELDRRFRGKLARFRHLFSDGAGSGGHVPAPEPPSSGLAAGARLGGYTIERQIGSGAFSTVYSASDEKLNRRVAIKVLRPLEASPENRQRMVREAQAVATIEHRNVVPVFEIGEVHGRDYIVCRLIDGPTLHEVLTERSFPQSEAAELVAQLAGALHAAHECGIVHRDVKPANVLMEGETPLLVDFGLAHLSEASAHLTGEGDIIGTPAYMSPEQAGGLGWQADPRSDIYSLGAVLYQMICGKRTFSGSAAEVLGHIINSEPEHPSRIRPGLDKDLVTICLKAIERTPEDRYQTADAMEQDLRRYLNGETIRARRAGVSTRVWKWAKRKPVLASLCAATLLLLTFLGGALLQLDRARKAEDKTRGLLAISAAKAGELAMQRGRMAEAVQQFDEAIRLGRADAEQLRLAQVEALVALRRLDDAAEVLSRMDSAPVREAARGAYRMWRGELALEGFDAFGDAAEQFELARTSSLPEKDRLYVEGMLAESSPNALTQFQAALEIDPFHHRARRMTLVVLIALARFDEAQREVHTALEVFPDDQDFLLMQSLLLALRGDFDAARTELAAIGLEEPTAKAWDSFILELGLMSQVSGPIPSQSIGLLGSDLDVGHFDLLAARGWHLPLKVSAAFEGIWSLLARGSSGVHEEVRDRLGRIVAIHPEGSLMVALGEQFTAGATTRGSVADAERARDLFLAALRQPMAIRASREYATRGVFSTTTYLALVAKKDSEENTRHYLKASREMTSSTISLPSQLRVLTISSLIADDLKLAETWAERWLERDPESPDAVWHRAIVHDRKGEYLPVLPLMDTYLRLKPDAPEGIGLRDKAREEVRRTLGAGESADDSKHDDEPKSSGSDGQNAPG